MYSSNMRYETIKEKPRTLGLVVRGADDIRALISSLFQGPKPKMAFGITNADMLERHFPEFRYGSGNPARLAARVPSKVIYTCESGPVYGKLDHLLLRESRYLPPETLSKCGDLTIVGDVVVFMVEEAGEPQALALTSAALARQMQGIFEVLWSCGSSNFPE